MPPFYVPASGPDILEQTVDYAVAPSQIRDLRRFSRKLRVSKDGGELSARGTSEEQNFLALNIADDILQGRRNPAQAIAFRERTLELAAAGKSSPYLRGLRFGPRRSGERP